jgi:phytoene dehydrogenase-like protein
VLRANREIYDAVIIGAGIGGLVCGCYLAKTGMKVLIAEQHHKPGGYCTSFTRKGFTFDAAAHSFGGYRAGGRVRKVLTELGVAEKLLIRRTDPTDVIISPDYRLTFFADPGKTLLALQEAFPHERKALVKFFSFLESSDPLTFVRIRKWTFKRLMDDFMSDGKLKSLLAFPILGNGGLPPSKISAFIGSKLFSEFLLDGGYYPEGGMQSLADVLAARFEEVGGELVLSKAVRKIRIHNGLVAAVSFDTGEDVPVKYVIANCDTRQVFFNLIGKEYLDENTIQRFENASASSSMFILYLGLDQSCDKLPLPGVNMWVLADYDLDRAFDSIMSCDFENLTRFMIRVQPGGRSLMALVNIAFNSSYFWQTNKDLFADAFLTAIEQSVPGLRNHVVFKEAASPETLRRFTRNYQGAAYGWAATPEQLGDLEFKKPHYPRNLLFSGHWAMQGLGIPSVVYVGMDTATYVLNKVARADIGGG